MKKEHVIIIAGVGIGIAAFSGLFEKKPPGDGEKEGEYGSPFEMFGRILGSQGGEPGITYNLPQQPAVTFPDIPYTESFRQPIVEVPQRDVARRSGAGMTSAQRTAYDIMSVVGRGGGTYTAPKKETVSRTLLPIAPAGVAAKGAIQAAASTEAQRISSAGVAGGGALTSFFRDIPKIPSYAAKKISSAGVAGSGSISSAVRSVSGGSKKPAPTTSKKSTYVRRSKTGYTYRGGKLTPK
jgi:hypothetical protein